MSPSQQRLSIERASQVRSLSIKLVTNHLPTYEVSFTFDSGRSKYFVVEDGSLFMTSGFTNMNSGLAELAARNLTEDGIFQFTQEGIENFQKAIRQEILSSIVSSEMLADLTEEELVESFRAARIANTHDY